MAPTINRAHATETWFGAIMESGGDGNIPKVVKIIDLMYDTGLMPITQPDLVLVEGDYVPPTDRESYYIADEKRSRWLIDNHIAHTVLRQHDFGMTEFTFADAGGEDRFRRQWC